MNKNKNLDKKNWKLINFSEIDKYAVTSYCAIHNIDEELNLGDITGIEETRMKDFDLITYGFPCQDISLSGKQKGFTDKEGNKTRSGLFFDALRIIEEKKPKIAIAENVKNLTSKKFQKEFDIVLTSLNEAGYNNYWKVLNAKDFGIPQNRERVFIVSIRKDIDNGMFEFPNGFELKLRLKDMLEDEVDEKYYLSKKVQDRLTITDPTFTKSIIGTTKPECRTIGQRDLVYQENSIMGTLVATDYKQPKQILEVRRIGGVFDDEKSKHQAGSIYDIEGLAPTLDTMQGGYRQPCIKEPVICASRGRNPDNPSSRVTGEPTEQRIEVNTKGLANTLTTVQKDNLVLESQIIKTDIKMPVRVRKYIVDCDNLIDLLRKSKAMSGLTNNDIALKLNIPITKVEHWFRKDNSFAIPDAEIWFELKEILGIKTNEFDESIITFEEREGVYEKSNRCYHEEGIAPTLTRANADEKIIVNDKPICVGQVSTGNSQAGKVYSPNGVSQTLCAGTHGYAMGNIEYNQKIRKLTPLECWRLMGFSDDQFFKAKKSLNDKHYKGKDKSNSQLYKQAGNSIVVDVLFYIFIELYKTMPQVFNDLKVTSLFSGIGAFEVALDRLYKLLNQMN